MTARSASWRRSIARAALVLGGVFVVWLPAGILDVVPFVLELPGESSIRVHAAAAVACLMVAAWGFWNE
ncbi:MAG: hypothetical protein NT024_07065 [Proteobacteria bacterium]|jgi:hypothetical protein|nr:hypothetical protein [Pseudomonadota bacterium]